ncbi:MAG: adenosylcobinamide-GDP ribazoletransferase [Actinomycetota bacterium]
MSGFRTAVSLLTRVPAGAEQPEAKHLGRAVAWFPVVGGLLGLLLAASYIGALVLLPPLAASGMAVGVGIALTGALHEDGLADTADALGGARSKEDALRILKDPSLGTYGVLAIVLSVLLRVLALGTLDGWRALAFLPGAHALSRGAAGLLLAARPAATRHGLGAAFSAATTRREVSWAVVSSLLLGGLFLGAWVVPAAALALLGAAAIAALSVQRIGGMTGDVLGAVQQVAEIAILLLGAAAARGWPSSVVWWR